MTAAPGPPRLELPAGWCLDFRDRVASTNDEAKALARAGAPEGWLVWAREQTQGRGSRGRPWASPPGNLQASLILRPRCPLARAGETSFLAALGLIEAIAPHLPPGGRIAAKWPNDVLLNGRKAAGILIESEPTAGGGVPALADWLVVGVGVNVAAHPPDTRFPATSLAAEGLRLTPAALLEGFAARFADWLARWRAEGFASARAAWLERAAGLGQPISVRLPGRELSGRFAGLDGGGALMLRSADGGERIVTAGEVFFDEFA